MAIGAGLDEIGVYVGTVLEFCAAGADADVVNAHAEVGDLRCDTPSVEELVIMKRAVGEDFCAGEPCIVRGRDEPPPQSV